MIALNSYDGILIFNEVWVNFWKVGFSWSRHTFLSSSKQLFNTKLFNFKRSRPVFVVTFWRLQDLTFFNITISHFYLGALFADRCNSFWFGDAFYENQINFKFFDRRHFYWSKRFILFFRQGLFLSLSHAFWR